MNSSYLLYANASCATMKIAQNISMMHLVFYFISSNFTLNAQAVNSETEVCLC